MTTSDAACDFQLLRKADVGLLMAMLGMFGRAFEDADSYGSAVPSEAYLSDLLGGDQFIAVAALKDDEVVGGLAAYVLPKFEQERKEIYIYDLAVLETYRRQGIASGLIRALQDVALERGVYVILVQADPEDGPAVRLYEGFGERQEVLHFDIETRNAILTSPEAIFSKMLALNSNPTLPSNNGS